MHHILQKLLWGKIMLRMEVGNIAKVEERMVYNFKRMIRKGLIEKET